MDQSRSAPSSRAAPPRSFRRDGWSGARQLTFLSELARTRSVTKAARAADMSRESAYRLRARDPHGLFAAAWDRMLREPSPRQSRDHKAVAQSPPARAASSQVLADYRRCPPKVTKVDDLLFRSAPRPSIVTFEPGRRLLRVRASWAVSTPTSHLHVGLLHSLRLTPVSANIGNIGGRPPDGRAPMSPPFTPSQAARAPCPGPAGTASGLPWRRAAGRR